MPRTTKADLEVALKAIITAASAYHAQGPQAVIEEIVRRAKSALDGEYGGIAERFDKRSALPKPVQFKQHGKVYDRKSGVRLTDCCGASSTYSDGMLCCKQCWGEVETGEGDGTEIFMPEVR